MTAPTSEASARQVNYHGGPVLTHSTTTYIIYWQGSTETLPADYIPEMGRFIDDWSGSQAHGVLTQYYQRSKGKEFVSNTVTYGGAQIDTTPFPSTTLSPAQIAGEVKRFVHSRHLPEGYGANYGLVLPPQTGADDGQGDCAWHDWVADQARAGKIFYSVVPFYTGTGYCAIPGPHYPNGAAVDNAIDRLSHELAEVATNPWHDHAAPDTPRSWYVDAKRLSKQAEIGDLCRFVFGPRNPDTGSNVILNGHPYLIQTEWSNADRACSMGVAAASCGHVWGGTSDDPFTFYSLNIKAVGTNCPVARAVADGWGKATSFDGPAPLDLETNGFLCTRRDYMQAFPLARCTREAAVVLIFKAPQVPAIVDYTGYVNFAIKPPTITQGASNKLYNLGWLSWGGASSTATGRITAEATSGNYRNFPVKVSAYAIGDCQGLRVYTRLHIQNLQSHQGVTETLHCQLGQYF